MATISVAMICQNEQGIIGRAIENVINFIDEMVIVDGGSTDDTVKEIKSFNSPKIKLFEIPFQKDFALQKNNAIQRCSGEWILVMDADELFEDDLLKNLQRLTTLGYDSYAFARKTRIDGVLNNVIDQDFQIRFWKNGIGVKYVGRIHESSIGMKKLTKCNLYIEHNKTFEQQEIDNRLYWDMGQDLPSDVRKVNGKYVRINKGG